MNGSTGMWIFVALAVVIVIAFGASLYLAGGRGKNGSSRRRLLPALYGPLLVGGLYAACGTPAALSQQVAPAAQAGTQAAGQPPMHDAADMAGKVQHLADRLKQHPEDMDGWLLLARSYTMLGRQADAETAYEHAQSRVMQDSGLLLNWIDLRLTLNNQKFDPRTRELLAQATKLAPDDSNVLMFRAMDAFGRGDHAGAKVLVDKLYKRYPQGTPERKDLDATLQSWMTAGAPGKQ